MSERMRDWLLAIPPAARAKVADGAGTRLSYLYKKLYTTPRDEMPHFKARIAVGIDSASNGRLDFRDLMEDGRQIDWEYVRNKLNDEALGAGTTGGN